MSVDNAPPVPPRRERPQTTEDFVREIKEAADKLLADGASRGDVKLLCTAFKELRHCFKVFGRYKGRRKATVFGSARTKPDHPTYQQAVGFGTHDEAFEALTLIQTGKSHLFPVVMVDQPGGTYWNDWNDFIETELKGNGLISPADTSLFRIARSVDEAVAEVTG